MRAEAVAAVTRLYPFMSGCGMIANHRFVATLSGRSRREAWAQVEGGKLLVHLDDYVGRAAFFVGDLDRKVSALVDRVVKPGDTVLDIGANIGLVTLRLAKRVGPTGTVHAFEPSPSIAARLRASLLVNSINNVRVHELALGDETGTLPITIPAGNAGMASMIAGRVIGETHQVPVKRLDDMDVGPIAFIKMDVEGFEEKVLRGFSGTLKRCPPRVILFEQNDAREAPIELLIRHGYRISGVAKSLTRLRLHPITEWSPAYNDYVAVHPISCTPALSP
jgi:FkbM family methyltransferase